MPPNIHPNKMEPTRLQLARFVPHLIQHRGTIHSSVSNDRVALAYMGPWNSFVEEAMNLFQSTPLDHDVPIHNESEVYVVGSELGLSARFVRNLCDPVTEALRPLSQNSIRFGDIQALIPTARAVPDIAFGLLDAHFTPSNEGIYMVGEYKTPWTVYAHQMTIDYPNPDPQLETLIGQLANKMRAARVRYAFLTTYNYTVFVKRASDLSFLLSRPFRDDSQGPSLRELFVGFCLMAMSDPKYYEAQPDTATILRGTSSPQAPEREFILLSEELLPPNTPQTITPTSVIIKCGTSSPIIVNCTEEISYPGNRQEMHPGTRKRAVWLAEINGVRRVFKCCMEESDRLYGFDTETAVYDRLHATRPDGYHFFPKCLAWGRILCSSLFPTGYAIIFEHREGELLCDIWHTLDATERAHIKAECLKAMQALRSISIRWDDAGMHNILYARECRTVTILDFEAAAETPDSSFRTSYEMEKIFRPHFD
ncbi:hypothetical protein PENFLA_c029G03807 [Penicillium flavigenum]|uniref:Protein kinase domain-containing protein n=1 Tax=Penicillium flavigenum TaxID=254877 RepID=A0A1V6SQV9_9EURO|nr:hypothetical protein PENFLA_c029G03807 [Penicillium flavigenum]